MTDDRTGPVLLRLRLRPGGEVARRAGVGEPEGGFAASGGWPPVGRRTAGAVPAGFPCEFHVAAAARRKYATPESLFRSNGNAVFADFHAVRGLAAQMNALRGPGEAAVRAGELNAMGLIDEILHYVFRLYETRVNPGVLARGIGTLERELGGAPVRAALRAFTERFPPVPVFRGEQEAARWLAGRSDGRDHSEVSVEEVLMLHLANLNPAFTPFRELFDESPLASGSAYNGVVSGIRTFLRAEKPFGAGGESIVDFLEAPMKAHPGDLAAQLNYIRDRWGVLLDDGFRRRILSAGDLSREDAKQYPVGGTGAVEAPDYARLARSRPLEYPETENFTHDLDWMPNVVLLAKNTYVWLHQLSRAYGRSITRLDQVPDEELDRLAGRNFTSLWLIGVWHRSPASERIKKLTGNPEAAPSAYSLHDYEIAPDLGGEEAFGSLADRAWRRGIRLAADMVPNHTGITSHWMRDHPDRFIQTAEPPFPSYRFTGPDLSDDPSYQVRIEDGYWNRSDAAVVFQRIDNRTGGVRYVYHGNDGTNMPWNDTAQLDFLRRDVREEVIAQILRVARKFSVIRFDAAMTLTKKHFHRLWYPHPGTGGDIPSRADHALMQEEFDRRFPTEFWREVVDRINREAPDTLLLAEAFWLLEGYFVRTLGMHRVYNSAFMHMLMKEDNALYRGAIRSTLHFNPGILKRYVNFMSNPDERTAIDQFGGGDKYFGVATLMVTLPGLPMFAHGQVEGFREKYGMEYRRDYHDEDVDEGLVRRHEREIFPLLGLRRLFSETEHFELYDVTDASGRVIEDVFAYSNMAGGMRAVVCYNNRYETYAGALRHSAGKLAGGSVQYRTLGDALRLRGEEGVYYVFREQRSGLEYVRAGSGLHRDGLHIRLRAFESQVFLDFREAVDADGSWRILHDELGGSGTPDAAGAARTIRLRPFHRALATLIDPAILARSGPEVERRALDAVEARRVLEPSRDASDDEVRSEIEWTVGAVTRRVAALRTLFGAAGRIGRKGDEGVRQRRILLAALLSDAVLGAGRDPGAPLHGSTFDEWQLGSPAGDPHDAALVRCLLCGPRGGSPRAFYGSPEALACLRLNEHDGTVYFHRESFEELADLDLLRRGLTSGEANGFAGEEWPVVLSWLEGTRRILRSAAEKSGYRLDRFLGSLDSVEFLTLPEVRRRTPLRGS